MTATEKELVFFLEEPCAKKMLEIVVPKIAEDLIPKFVIFEGKQDLEKRLKKRLQGWQNDNAKFIIMRDQDRGECRQVKQKLIDICQATNKRDCSLVRIACRELESFYLGDLAAVEKGMEISGLAGKQKKSKFRNPDTLGNPFQELAKLTNKKYQKASGSRAIAPHLNIENNHSKSFNVLISGIKQLFNIE